MITILIFPTVYKPENESNVAQLFASSAEVLADWGFVCPANKFSREWKLQGSKVNKRPMGEGTVSCNILPNRSPSKDRSLGNLAGLANLQSDVSLVITNAAYLQIHNSGYFVIRNLEVFHCNCKVVSCLSCNDCSD